jgi:circadian clock protein KaiC
MELRPSLRVLVLFPASSLAESMSDTESCDEGTARISTGIAGLDDILRGGLDRDRLYLIEGTPGTGKTTLALQFLLEGSKKGEMGLYVTLSESEKELRVVAARHGWSLDGLSIFELIPPEASLDPDHEQTLFHPAELELSETTKLILDRVTALNRRGWFLIACRKCDYSRRTRYAIAAKSWH